MPLYEYQCDECGHRFEQIQKFSDPIVEICPACGKNAVKRLLSSPAIQFKGSGWYITDYPKKNTSDAGAVSGKDEKSGKSESKDGKTTTDGAGKSSEKSGESSKESSSSTGSTPAKDSTTTSKKD